jgi:hypothetical protein
MGIKIIELDDQIRRRFAAETRNADSDFVTMFDEPEEERDLVDLLEDTPKVSRRLA